MGADFIWARVDISEGRDVWVERLEHLPDAEVFAALLYHHDWDHYDGDIYAARSEIMSAIDVCFDRSRRDVGRGWFGDNYEYLITGGLSWGDEPTEAFASAILFSDFQYWYSEVRVASFMINEEKERIDHGQMMIRLHTTIPEWMPEQLDDDRVIGWRLMTEAVNGVAKPVGYQIVSNGGIYESNMDGLIYRATNFNMIGES